jgi:hypothetical protein
MEDGTMIRYILSIFLIFAPFFALEAKNDSTAVVHSVSLGLRPAALTQHHGFYRGENATGRPVAAALSTHLQYAFSFPASSAFGQMFPTSYQGVGVAYYTFFNHNAIGSPAAVYVFQGARITQLTEALSLDYEWNFGVSSFWKPNIAVGTKVNAYINAGLMLSWRPLPEWNFSAGVDFTHFSNGDTTLPNVGVNTFGVRLTASRSFGDGLMLSPDKPFRNRLTEKSFLKRTSLDVILCCAWYEELVTHKSKDYKLDGKFGVLALHVNPLYKLTHYLSVGPSVDIQFNEGINLSDHVAGVNPVTDMIRFHRPPLSEQLGIGLSARVEFHAPIFSINFGVGHNVIYKGTELSGLYYILALKSFVYENLFIHTGLKICNSTSSNNLLLGLGWRFGN